jgi:hypothetical protein
MGLRALVVVPCFVFAAVVACSGASDDPADPAVLGAGGEGDAATSRAPSHDDGVKNLDETDVDCGGPGAPPCATGKTCAAPTDCVDAICTGGTCAAPRPDDGVKNGDESDVDCGGSTAPRCKVEQACKVHADCASDGCSYLGRCALARSCAVRHGGDTCGAGVAGADRDPASPAGAAAEESCCVSLPVPLPDGKTVNVDKYLVTAGRMRAFVERTNGNLRKWIEDTKPKEWWQPEWTAYLPSSVEEVHAKLGPYPADGFTRQGCVMAPGGGGARTYWQPPGNADYPDEKQSYAKDVLDDKALNCVELFMLAAFCLWDGGHLAHSADLVAAWGPLKYPWGDTPSAAQTSTMAYAHVVHEFGVRFEGPFTYTWPKDELDNTAHIAPPGRKPLGKGPYGHMDLAGLMLPMTLGFGTAPNGTAAPIWIYAGSWEAHEIPETTAARYYVANDSYKRAYWAAGGRCSR